MSYSIKSIFKRYKWKISITFFLLTTENILKIIQPFVLGIAINDLIQKKNNGILLFCLLYGLSFITGVIRRYYDTRAYTFIYTNIATEIAEKQHENNVSVSSISARSSLVKELVDFFEHDVTQIFSSVISVVGALFMLTFFSWSIFWISIGVIFLIFLIYSFSNNTIYKYNLGLNDELEHRINILESKKTTNTYNHFNNISKWLVKLSDLETLNFGIIEVILFGLVIFSLYIAAGTMTATAGGIFSIVTYVIEFSTGIYMLPFVFQQLIRLKEISSRIQKV
ncbi:ABC transporter six-transmembrane domain-containing protein [Aureivirga sp. CE67]|uniref:ABC transporter six-transmembrane domain-containing protein n=1 Tax=Aureivirga sp. CE67 TaxID=1788983 RepID=UPI0018CAD8DA|nr:ABC transporter six-transmembrane domain-containing protein [Aureivirga sp. CE67]